MIQHKLDCIFRAIDCHRLYLPNNYMKFLIITKSIDPDDMPHFVASGADPGFLERGFVCINVWGVLFAFADFI